MINAAITAVSGYVPDYVLTNQELEQMVDTSDEWIISRTGIKERRILKGEGKGVSEIAYKAVERLLKEHDISPLEIDMIICTTISADYKFPSTSNIVCDKVGATNAWGFDLGSACSGFLFGLHTGAQFIKNGTHKKVIVVGADKMSSVTDFTNRNTCILFGDGAGAVLLEPNTEGLGIQDAILKSDGSGSDLLILKNGGSAYPITKDNIGNKDCYIYQDGPKVFKFAVTRMADVAEEIMERNHLSAEDIAYLVPHQANNRIIEATAQRMGINKEKVMINIERYGNTTSGTIPLCLWDFKEKCKKGDNLILAAFGGGFTWGSIYLKWAI